jgi:two-component system cell cycle sensor histidine kinase/response regulator CckA
MSDRETPRGGPSGGARDPAFGEALLRGSLDGICACRVGPDPSDVRFTVWNGRMEEITGFSVDRVNRDGWPQTLIPDPEAQARAAAGFRALARGGPPLHEEWEARRADGQPLRLSFSASAVGREGDAAFVLAFVRDVTEAHRASQAVARSARVSEKIHSMLVRLGGCHTVEEMLEPLLEAALESTGMSGGGIYLVEGGAAVLRRHRGLPEGFVRAVARMPMDHPGVRAACAREGVSSIREISAEVAGLLDAHALLHSAYVIPLRSQGAVIGFLNLASDREPDPGSERRITILAAEAETFLRRVRMEEALRDQERFLRNVFDTIQDGLSVLDRDLVIVRVNRWMERMYAHAAPIAGRKCYEAYHGRKAVCEVCPTVEAIRTGEACTRRVPYTTARGPEGWLDLTAFPLKDAEGRVTGVIEHVKDVTARVQAEEEGRRLEAQVLHVQKLESLGVLAGGIAHDFNNLLMGILGNADLALQEMSPVAPGRAFLLEIEKASRRAADLCRQMLAYSGKGRFVVEPIDLSELVEEMAHLLQVSVSKKAVLRVHFASGLPPVMADATQLRQVIMNLITNASEAIGDRSGVISIATGLMECDRAYFRGSVLDENLPEGAYAFLEVTDTGVGMTPETLARIFDPFFTTKFQGRGLGLSAVLGIVRGHRGAVKVYTEPGKGSTFKVLLPAAREALPLRRGKPAAPSAAGTPGGATVLLADDDPTIRSVGKAMLEKLGYAVLLARDGTEALEIFRSRARDVGAVLLDLTMPSMDGEECFRELRRIRGDVRVILSSGYNEQEVVQRFTGKGLAGFIQKPYVMAALRDRLAEAFAAAPGPGPMESGDAGDASLPGKGCAR